jgi:hypothetical protein
VCIELCHYDPGVLNSSGNEEENMKTSRITKTVVCLAFLLLTVSCNNCGKKDGTVVPPPSVLVVADNGLDDKDRKNFYHLSEGTELFPYQWLKALYTKDNKPFLDNAGRFGLIDDPNDPNGLPIGMSIAKREGVPFFELVGFNCAACHVGQLNYKVYRFRIDGGPNLFDLNNFFTELGEDALYTVQDLNRFLAFLKRSWQVPAPSISAAPAQPTSTPSAKTAPTKTGKGLPTAPPAQETRDLVDRYNSVDELKNAGELEGALANEMKSVAAEAAKSDEKASDVSKAAKPPQPPEPTAYSAKAKELAKKSPSAGGIFSGGSEANRESKLANVLGDIKTQIALFKSYVDRIKLLASVSKDGTWPGFGRVDAFGAARTLVFGQLDPANIRPMTSPVSYPPLWGFDKIALYHYMANTNSALTRNLVQALATGATLDAENFVSTLNIANVNAMEVLGYKITVPKWPEEVFGKIDPEKAARGKALYQQNCADCHERFDTSPQGLWEMKAFPLEGVNTDTHEALDFLVPVTLNGQTMPEYQAIGIVVPKIEDAYYKQYNVPPQVQVEWNHGRLPVILREIRAYTLRPLAGIWASPPYLHGGSVPTLYDLLKPASLRPAKFYLGYRAYDPVHLGYVDRPDSGATFEYDTSQPGNANTGHEYGTSLPEDDKMALLEFLKSLTQQPLPPN